MIGGFSVAVVAGLFNSPQKAREVLDTRRRGGERTYAFQDAEIWDGMVQMDLEFSYMEMIHDGDSCIRHR